MTSTIMFALLAGHFVGDFVCQSDWMAQNKSKNSTALTLHVIVYTAIIAVTAIAINLLWIKTNPQAVGLWIVFNGTAHWVIDYITSRINAKLWAKKKVHYFFVGIGTDQLIHYACIIFSFQAMTGL